MKEIAWWHHKSQQIWCRRTSSNKCNKKLIHNINPHYQVLESKNCRLAYSGWGQQSTSPHSRIMWFRGVPVLNSLLCLWHGCTIAKHMKIVARVNMADRWELSSKLSFPLFQPLASYFKNSVVLCMDINVEKNIYLIIVIF